MRESYEGEPLPTTTQRTPGRPTPHLTADELTGMLGKMDALNLCHHVQVVKRLVDNTTRFTEKEATKDAIVRAVNLAFS